MINFISEVGSSFEWVYRGWFYIGSSSYRDMVRLEHSKRSKRLAKAGHSHANTLYAFGAFLDFSNYKVVYEY